MRQPLKMLFTITVSPFTRGCQQITANHSIQGTDSERTGTCPS